MSRHGINIGLMSTAFMLSLISVAIVYQNVNDEPFLAYRYSDVVSQVIFSTAIATTWAWWALLVCVLIWFRRVSPLWIGALIWAMICMLFLLACSSAYFDDLERFVLHTHG
jgi:hypothetical protein